MKIRYLIIILFFNNQDSCIKYQYLELIVIVGAIFLVAWKSMGSMRDLLLLYVMQPQIQAPLNKNHLK